MGRWRRLQKEIADTYRVVSNRVEVYPATLTLYLARKKGETVWLAGRQNVKDLLRGAVDTDYPEMFSWLKLDNEELFGTTPSLGEENIHVLVELPAAKKQRLSWRSTRWGSHAYDKNSQYFLLEKEDMDESGLPPIRLMLYCRPTFHSQFEFLRERVLNEGHLGWILGPPGTGKSTTAMAFASTLDRSEWIVTWIHVGKNMKWRCVRLIGDERKTRAIDIADVDEVLRIDDDTMHHLVLVDGWTPADSFTQLTVKCVEWFLESNEMKQRRLSFVCSVAARGKFQEDMEILTRAREFRVWSWTLDEYLNAIKDDEVFQSVSQCLDAPAVLPDEEMSRSAMVESKYYYAGGSCRYMFHFRTATVAMKLSDAVDSLNDAATVATSGQRSSLSINRLFGMFQRPYDVGAVSPVISRYVATLIAVRCGPEAIKKFMSTHRDSSNPALNGWMLEMVFFASLRNGGLALVDAAGNTVGTWGQSVIVVADEIPALSSAHPIWIKPEKWNQGGYDAIMVCKRTQHVRFVQVTSAHKHSFRIGHFYGWLKMLSESPESFEVKTMKIIFVVQQDKLSTFDFSTVTGDGLLVPFGWPKGKETDLVRLVGILGLYNLSQ
uniref:Crinkler n=1 Tax=Lagenidium giganteum TaxID=4803 RepID=W0G5E2_9STRA|nr:crinkler [Lagenidium giganteum]